MKFKEKKSVYKGLVELINAGVIARGSFENNYYVNTAMVVNGDRFTIMNMYEKQTGKEVTPRKREQEKWTPVKSNL